MPADTCPLCQSTNIAFYHSDKKRTYLQCQQCQLVYVSPQDRLSSAQEKAIYDQHQNNPDDIGYRRFLNRVAQPLIERLPTNAVGLDFGCGPGPTLSVMLQEHGLECALYDIFYFPDTQALQQRYDFITCTEAIEHFCQPSNEWQQLLSMLKPGGYLALMTKLVIDKAAFSQWHYKNDQTHVSFFSRATFEYLAHQHRFQLTFIGNDVILLQTPNFPYTQATAK